MPGQPGQPGQPGTNGASRTLTAEIRDTCGGADEDFTRKVDAIGLG